jgi:ABC-type uncharacterized transport system fused permease/ATPase subunit
MRSLRTGPCWPIAFRFISLTEQKNQAEAEYRYALTRVREHAGSIALLEVAWDRILFEGEKPRLAIVRLYSTRPLLLHVEGEAELMALVARELPEATIISLGHRPELEAFHHRKLTIARKVGGAVIVADTSIRRAPISGDERPVSLLQVGTCRKGEGNCETPH